ncbi:MAG TPA: M48 family metalloprotease [Gammaproteobacteria bacterium]|nr:M48 family metalloprotease [Gammaproteobacteria bacterium]
MADTSIRQTVIRRAFIAAAMTLLSVFLPAQAAADNLPSLGGNRGGDLTAAQEREIGQQFLQQARRQLTFVRDPEVLEYVRTLGQRVAAQTDFHAYPFHFYVIRDPSLNAFAVPGGHIFLHSGLIQTADSAAEVAGVLAHEVAHITQRHMARQMAAGKQSQLSSLLLVAAGILAGMQGQGEAAEALVFGAGAYSQQEMLAYSRAHEHEADRLGIQYLAEAGFDPEGLPGFLQKLQDWAQLQGASPAPFLSTHPLTQARVSDARNRAARMGRGGPTPLGEATFGRIQARLRALTAESPQQAYDHFQQRVSAHPDRAAARYGLALAARRTGRSAEAVELLQELIQNAPESVAYRRTLADVQLGDGQPAAAVATLRAALERRPGDPGLRERLGEALVAADRAADGRRILLELTRDYSQRSSAFSALAQAYSRLDRPIDAHRTEAEARWLAGQRTEALEQLRLAARLAREQGDPRLGQIQARIRELEPGGRLGPDNQS